MRRSLPGPAGMRNAGETEEIYASSSDRAHFHSQDSSHFPFHSASWCSLCRNLGVDTVDIKQEGQTATQTMLESMKVVTDVTIQNVLEGCYDLKIPRMIAVIKNVTLTYDGSWLLELQDPSGSMTGFITSQEAKKIDAMGAGYRGVFNKGSAMLLEKVSIFVSKGPPMQRLLSIHSKCIRAVYS